MTGWEGIKCATAHLHSQIPRHRSTIKSNTRVMAGRFVVCMIDLPGCLMALKCSPKVHKARAQFFGAWYSAGSHLESKVAHWIMYAYSCIKQIQSLLWHWTKLSTCSINILTLFGQVRWKASSITHWLHHQTHTHRSPKGFFPNPLGSIQTAKMRFLLLPAIFRTTEPPPTEQWHPLLLRWEMGAISREHRTFIVCIMFMLWNKRPW